MGGFGAILQNLPIFFLWYKILFILLHPEISNT